MSGPELYSLITFIKHYIFIFSKQTYKLPSRHESTDENYVENVDRLLTNQSKGEILSEVFICSAKVKYSVFISASISGAACWGKNPQLLINY